MKNFFLQRLRPLINQEIKQASIIIQGYNRYRFIYCLLNIFVFQHFLQEVAIQSSETIHKRLKKREGKKVKEKRKGRERKGKREDLEIKLKDGSMGKEIKLVATFYTPVHTCNKKTKRCVCTLSPHDEGSGQALVIRKGSLITLLYLK